MHEVVDLRRGGRGLEAAFRTNNYALVTNHGVDAELIESMYRVTRKFFELPATIKRTVAAHPPSRFCGYASPTDLAGRADLVETFAVSRFDTAADMVAAGYAATDAADHPPNLWPDRPAAMREVWHAYLGAMDRLATKLVSHIGVALGAPKDWVATTFGRHASGLIANFYPAQLDPPAPGLVRRSEHTDFGAVTILYQDSDIGGLQVKDHSGAWQTVPLLRDSFVVTLGDLVEAWSSHTWHASPHRVVNPPRAAGNSVRMSIPFFFHPNRDAVIKPVASLDAGPERSFRSDEWIRHRERQALS